MSRRAVIAVLAALAAAAGVAFLLQASPPDIGPERADRKAPGKRAPNRLDLLQRLLDRRAAAIARADAKALVATATGPQRARDRRTARRLKGLGVHKVRLRADGGDVRRDRLVLRARLSYGVRGIAGRFAAGQRLSLRWTGRDWRVRAATARRGRVPWEVAPQRRLRSRHFVVWAPRSVDVGSADLMGALERGYARMREVLEEGRLRRRYLVVLAADAGQARALTAAIRGVAGLAAITDTEVRLEGEAERVVEVASQRLLVVWPAFLQAGPEARQTVVAHELTHAALARATSGRTPAWLVEGLALYVSGDDRTAEAARLLAQGATGSALTLRGLADPEVIATLDGEDQNAAYAYASAAAFHVVARYGRDALLDLYDVFNEESLRGSRGSVRLSDRAARRVLGVSLQRLERDLRARIAGGG